MRRSGSKVGAGSNTTAVVRSNQRVTHACIPGGRSAGKGCGSGAGLHTADFGDTVVQCRGDWVGDIEGDKDGRHEMDGSRDWI